MKFSKVLSLAILSLAVLSCKEDPTVRVPAKMQLENQDATTGISTLNFRSAGSTQTFSIQAEGDWYVRHPKDVNWVTVSPSKGTGDAVLTVRVDSHDGEDPRSATFAFVCDGLEQKGLLKVTQAQKYYVEASVLSNVVSKSGGDITVTLKSNGTPTCTIDDSGSSWLQVVSVGAKEAVLRAAPIAASAAKNVASVTFSCEEDSDAQTVLDFTQKNLTIKLDVKEINASGTMADRYAIEGDLDVITMNVNDWIPVSNAEWLEASKTADGKLHWRIAGNNPACEVRSTELMAVCNDSPEDADVMGIVVVNQYPGADIIDFKFNQDGTAVDNSANNNAFTNYAGDGSKVTYKYIEDYCSWAPSTNYGTENSAVEYKYGFWYTNYSSYKPLMEDGFTMEAIFSPNSAHNVSKEAKVFSTTQSGGFAIMLGASGAKTNPCDNVDVTRNGSIEFIMHKNGNWNFLVTNVMVEVGKFYHVIGVYDPAAETIKCYVDGELKFTTTGTGALKWPTGHSNFAVCGNTNGDTKMNGSANVTVPVARVYSDPLSTEEVALLTRLAKAPGFEVVK